MGYYDKDRTDNPRRVMKHPGPGLGSVAEYQMSGRPYVMEAAMSGGHLIGDGVTTEAFTDDDGSVARVRQDDVTITFPFITKRVTIKNLAEIGGDDDPVYIYFASLLVPLDPKGVVVDAEHTDTDGDGTAVDIVSRGNKVTTTELDAYNGAFDYRPSSAVLENSHYYELGNGEEIDMSVRCRRIYLAGSETATARVYAELTGIVHPYNLDLRGIDGITGGDAGSAT